MKFPPSYSGGHWHRHPKEVFANDFRLLVADREQEFWPHEVARPESVPEVIDYWNKVVEEFNL